MLNHKKLLVALNQLAVKGLYHYVLLTHTQKKDISLQEEPLNKGVLETLKRRFTICCIHDSSFREPTAPIVHTTKRGIILPQVPFPEFETIKIGKRHAKKVVSGSPGGKIHNYLQKMYQKKGIILQDDEATLLIGFD